MVVRRSRAPPHEIDEIRGLRTTTLHRTLRDLTLFGAGIDALIAVDMALHERLTTKARLFADSVATPGRRGSAKLRRLVELAQPAESPMETRLRSQLSRRGMARPEVQVDLHDDDGAFVSRADLYYPAARLVVEFDGGDHRKRLVADDRRQNLLVAPVSLSFASLRPTSISSRIASSRRS